MHDRADAIALAIGAVIQQVPAPTKPATPPARVGGGGLGGGDAGGWRGGVGKSDRRRVVCETKTIKNNKKTIEKQSYGPDR